MELDKPEMSGLSRSEMMVAANRTSILFDEIPKPSLLFLGQVCIQKIPGGLHRQIIGGLDNQERHGNGA